nr:response regulator [Rhizobium skierniewicense]
MPLRVLIVEDEMLLALDLEDMLTGAGFVVVGQASDMDQALTIADRIEGRIDVAIMDVNLARGTNGVDTAAALRRRWNVPSLFVSGNLDERTRERAMEWQPIGFVGKPYSEREVLSSLGSYRRPSVCDVT